MNFEDVVTEFQHYGITYMFTTREKVGLGSRRVQIPSEEVLEP